MPQVLIDQKVTVRYFKLPTHVHRIASQIIRYKWEAEQAYAAGNLVDGDRLSHLVEHFRRRLISECPPGSAGTFERRTSAAVYADDHEITEIVRSLGLSLVNAD